MPVASPNWSQKTRGSRQQVIILRRQVKRPACTRTDRILLVFLARMVLTWKQALFFVQPETLLRWHRQSFKLLWKYKSRAMSTTPKISAETIVLIKEMARDNRLWGAERIRGELLKLGIRVCLPHHSEVHETRAHYKARRTDVEHVLTHPCQRHLGVRRACLSRISSSYTSFPTRRSSDLRKSVV